MVERFSKTIIECQLLTDSKERSRPILKDQLETFGVALYLIEHFFCNQSFQNSENSVRYLSVVFITKLFQFFVIFLKYYLHSCNDVRVYLNLGGCLCDLGLEEMLEPVRKIHLRIRKRFLEIRTQKNSAWSEFLSLDSI